jgi:hypothetical protein
VAGMVLTERIKEMEEFSKYYLPSSALDENGNFLADTYDALQEELIDKKLINIKSWIPYVPEKDAKQSRRLLKETVLFGLRTKEKQGSLRRVCNKAFQSRLKNKSIVDAYLDYYSEDLVYYHYSSNTENCFLLQGTTGEVKLIVFTYKDIQIEENNIPIQILICPLDK